MINNNIDCDKQNNKEKTENKKIKLSSIKK